MWKELGQSVLPDGEIALLGGCRTASGVVPTTEPTCEILTRNEKSMYFDLCYHFSRVGILETVIFLLTQHDGHLTACPTLIVNGDLLAPFPFRRANC